MSTVRIHDLPKICHYLHIIVLAADLEKFHRNVLRQEADPAAMRDLAIRYTTSPEDAREKQMVEDAYRTVIRIWQAMDDLGLKWDKRHFDLDKLIYMGLKR
jgi:hypothetical protein